MLAALAPEHLHRFRRGIAMAVLLMVVLAILFSHRYPELPLLQRFGPSVVALAALVLTLVASWIPAALSLIAVLQTSLGVVLVGCVATGAAWTGGFDAPILPMIYPIWIFASLVAPIATRTRAIWFGVELVETIVLILWLCPHPGPPQLFLMISLVVASFCIVGSSLHDQARVRLFLANERLESVNAELGERVREQVREIVERAHEVDALNAELRQKVQERSRELAEALRRLSNAGLGSAQLRHGDVFGGRVRIEQLLGQGGMGVVYLGYDSVTAGNVALKLMHPSISSDPEALQRFLSEAKAASAVPHPSIVKTLLVDVTADGRLYQIMEYVRGTTLSRWIQSGRLASAVVARVGSEVAWALAAAHHAGVVHRDIKPGNLILCATPPGVRVLDFGLSKILAADGEATALTRSHQMIGTPAYMSPEQVSDAAHVTGATDVYSLAIVIYEMLAGVGPYLARSGAAALYAAHLSEDPQPLARVAPGTDSALAALIQRCLAKTPEARPTAGPLAAELTAIADRLGAPACTEIGSRVIHATSEGTTVRGTAGTDVVRRTP
jgi:tRNA A-37 threonylcarbamoyl transferase component Bud32